MPSDGRMPFIMPDGRRLSSFLEENGMQHDKQRRCSKKGKKGGRDQWGDGSSQLNVQVHRAAMTDIEHVELLALDKVGARRRQRWQNEKLLRDMAGPLTASEMESLFKPAPFGYVHDSFITRAVAPENIGVWSHFLSINYDKEQRVLQKWEAHIREEVAARHNSAGCREGPAHDALRRWSRVSRRLRSALKSASPLMIAELEAQLLPLLERRDETVPQGGGNVAASITRVEEGGGEGAGAYSIMQEDEDEGGNVGEGAGDGGDKEVLLLLPDGFQRLLCHGLAEYHGLASCSRDTPDGRVLAIRRRRRGAAAAADADTSTASTALMATAMTAYSSGGGGAVAGGSRHTPDIAITCADLLYVLDDVASCTAAGGGGAGAGSSLTRAALQELLAERSHASGTGVPA